MALICSAKFPSACWPETGNAVISSDWGEKPANHQFTRLPMGFQYSSSTSLPELK